MHLKSSSRFPQLDQPVAPPRLRNNVTLTSEISSLHSAGHLPTQATPDMQLDHGSSVSPTRQYDVRADQDPRPNGLGPVNESSNNVQLCPSSIVREKLPDIGSITYMREPSIEACNYDAKGSNIGHDNVSFVRGGNSSSYKQNNCYVNPTCSSKTNDEADELESNAYVIKPNSLNVSDSFSRTNGLRDSISKTRTLDDKHE